MLLRELLKSKIHRATVTEADVNYVGSITIDQSLLEAVDLWPGNSFTFGISQTANALKRMFSPRTLDRG